MKDKKKKYDFKVLLVEDDFSSRLYATKLLQYVFDNIYVAENGALGLELYIEHTPELVISDIAMPIMDGLQMSRKIKQLNPKANIIFTTAFDNKQNMLEAIDIGISQYIIKPLDKNKFYDAVDRVANVINLEFELALQQQLLKNAHDELEAKVVERTAKLWETNEKLVQEIEVRKQIENELRNAKELAESANKAKSSFLAKVSHELRTPLNGIIGIASILFGTGLNEKQRNFIQMIKVSADNLLNIINDILDFSKIEAGKLKFQHIYFDLFKVIDQSVSFFYENARTKGIKIRYSKREDVPKYLIGDPGRLNQILNNLLGNAIKFTDKGSIELNIDVKETHQESVKILFSVKDTGIGIPNDKIDLLFKSFSQVDGSYTRKYGGTGLGLSISKELVENMGGSIWVESQVNKGSTFFFDILFKLPTKEQKKIAPAKSEFDYEEIKKSIDLYPSIQLTILVAEDSFINQEVLKQVLMLKDWNLVFVSSGSEALEAYRNTNFDFIFMDVQLPDVNGLELTKIIRAEEKKSGKRIPIVGLTAHNYDTNDNECIDAGMDLYLSKPFNWTDIFSAIYSLANNNKIKNDNFIDINNKTVDFNSILANLSGNTNVLINIIKYFIGQYPISLENLRNSIINKDANKARSVVHKFKSELSNFSAIESVEYCKEIDKYLKNNDFNNSMKLVLKLEKALKSVDVELTKFLNTL